LTLRRYLRLARESLTHPWVLGPCVGVLAILLSTATIMEVAELKLYDVNLRWRGPVPHRRDIIVVDVSEKTFDELDHAWPFPRAWFAQAIENVQAAPTRRRA
jgi:CHASE2 domain-containing sensor protein